MTEAYVTYSKSKVASTKALKALKKTEHNQSEL